MRLLGLLGLLGIVAAGVGVGAWLHWGIGLAVGGLLLWLDTQLR